MAYELGADLEWLVRGRGAALVAAVPIARHGVARPHRETWRLDFADGVRLKGRRLASAARAAEVEVIVGRLDPARFPRVVARTGVALLEAWVEGTVLEGGAGAVRTVQAVRWGGDTLGAVHRAAPPSGLTAPASPAKRFADDLAWLGARGLVGAAACARWEAVCAPDADAVLVHRDLHPENVVVDTQGALHAIDNAAACLGHADEDLARTLARWPMDAAAEAAFLGAYAAHRDPEPFLAQRGFWTATAAAHAARVRIGRGYAHTVEALRRLADALR
jgi:aminoglycoside phosphotransferase (APT) family kinase protein